MNCPFCGANIGQSDLFCPKCNNYIYPSLAPAEEAAPVPAAADIAAPDGESFITEISEAETPIAAETDAGAAITEDLSEKTPPPAPVQAAAKTKGIPLHIPPSKYPLIVPILLVVTALSLALACFALYNLSGNKVAQLKLDRERLTLLGETTRLGDEVADLKAELIDTKAQRDTLQQQADELAAQVSELENQANQNTYDQSTYESALEEAKLNQERLQKEKEELDTKLSELQTALEEKEDELAALEAELSEVKDQNAELNQRITDLEGENKALGDKAAFMDKYVVFCERDGTNLYHKYDCGKFKKVSFYVYNVRLAKQEGFSPCPDCIG